MPVYDPLRDIKGGPFQQFIARVGLNLRENLRLTLIIVAAILLGGVAFILYSVWRDSTEERAMTAYSELMRNPIMQQNASDPSAVLERLNRYESDFSGKNVRLRSNLKKIEVLEAAGDHEKAAELSLRVAEDTHNPDLKSFYSYRAASHFESVGGYAKALEYYESVTAGRKEDDILKALALFGQGRCLIRMGKVEDGKSAIRRMMELTNVPGGEELRIVAASFLMTQK